MFDVFHQQLDLKALQPVKRKAEVEPVEHTEKKVKQFSINVIEDEFEHQSKHSVRHQACVPSDMEYTTISDHIIKDRCRTWEFELDPFQEIAIRAIDRQESVLVAAHTSAGKTVTAEYAIAKALRDNQRVVYTSPIKALSNQKYRDFKKIFKDVGLMTGDNLIDPTASCLVMTTEILRSMFYLGSEVFRETSVIIFDEVHYLRDKERGVVWEESILLAPPSARFVFLSATIPNATQFASWVSTIHHHTCHVVYTDFRPVPLTHYIYPQGGSAIYNVYNGSSFKNESFQKAMKEVETSKFNKKKMGNMKMNQMDENPVERIVKLLTKKGMDPVILFCFSKKECEQYAIKIKLDFNTEEERETIELIYAKAVMKLDEIDRQLPQVEALLPILLRGIGIHHGGMLPLLKEIVEILFGKSLIKVLFATETFSIGLNFPARTCCFTGLKKFDGKEMRLLSSGEYIQMSGRAGRRSIDDQGLCVMMIDEHVESEALLNMITGDPLSLDSAFRLTYHMLLNLTRVEGISSDYLLENCFKQFQKQDALPLLNKKQAAFNKQLNEYVIDNESIVGDYFNTLQLFQSVKDKCFAILSNSKYCLPFLVPGRVVHVVHKVDYGWGIIVSVRKRPKAKENNQYMIDVLLHVKPQKTIEGRFHGNLNLVQPAITLINKFDNLSFEPFVEEDGEMIIIPCYMDSIKEQSTLRVQMPDSLVHPTKRKTMLNMLGKIKQKYTTIPLLDMVDDYNMEDVVLAQECSRLNEKLVNHEFLQIEQKEALLKQYKAKSSIKQQVVDAEKAIEECKEVLTLKEHNCYLQVLNDLSYISNHTIELKGRVACEISAGCAVLMTELIFNGFFNDLSPEVIVAILSCVVFSEKYEDSVPLPKEVQEPLKVFMDHVRKLAEKEVEHGLSLEIEECCNSYRQELVPVAYAWSQGTSFVDICKMTDVFEGSIVRMLRRLDELLRQMHSGCLVIGNSTLATSFDICSTKIRRGIVFTESLYL